MPIAAPANEANNEVMRSLGVMLSTDSQKPGCGLITGKGGERGFDILTQVVTANTPTQKQEQQQQASTHISSSTIPTPNSMSEIVCHSSTLLAQTNTHITNYRTGTNNTRTVTISCEAAVGCPFACSSTQVRWRAVRMSKTGVFVFPDGSRYGMFPLQEAGCALAAYLVLITLHLLQKGSM